MRTAAESRIDAATEKVMQNDPTLTRAQAYAKVLKAHPELYSLHLAQEAHMPAPEAEKVEPVTVSPYSAEGQLKTASDDIQANFAQHGVKLSREEAYRKALEADPALYQKYLVEQA